MKKVGKTIIFHIDITCSVASTGDVWITVATIPSAYAPSRDVYTVAMNRTTGDLILTLVDGVGNVQMINTTVTSSGIRGTLVWVIGN